MDMETKFFKPFSDNTQKGLCITTNIDQIRIRNYQIDIETNIEMALEIIFTLSDAEQFSNTLIEHIRMAQRTSYLSAKVAMPRE